MTPKRLQIDHMCKWGANRNPWWAGYRGGVEKSSFEIAAKRLEIDIICQRGANKNTWPGYRISSFQSPRTPNRGVVNLRPQIGHHVGSSSGLFTIVVMTLLCFVPLDDTIASRVVFVIISRLDRPTDGRNCFWAQLNNSKCGKR